MKLLIVIDVQNDFLDLNVLGTPEAQAIIPKVKRTILAARRQGYEVIYTRDTHQEDYLKTFEGKHLPVKHCIRNTEGWKIVKDIDIPEAIHIDKYDFGVNDWVRELKPVAPFWEIEEIMVCGLVSDICLITNCLNLRTRFPNIPIYVLEECCAGTTPEKHAAAMEVMKSCQIEVI